MDFKDRIISPPFDFSALTKPSVYGSLIQSIASDSAAAAYVANFLAGGGVFVGPGVAGVRYVYLGQQQNAARVRMSGFDVSSRYSFPLGSGVGYIGANIAIINKIKTTFTPTSTPTDLVNTYGNPLRLRIRSDFGWSRSDVSLGGALNFANAYVDTSVAPAGRISEAVTLDLSARYTFGRSAGALQGFSIGAFATNVFNQRPPYVGGSFGLPGVHYDVGNADPRGRVVSIELRKSW